MEDHLSSLDKPSSAIDQANQALQVAIRTAYLNRDIPLDTTYEVKPLPIPTNQQDRLITREVWVYQERPQERTFKLMTETLQIITTQTGGTELKQTIIEA